jgi:hypothetical protein
MDLNPLVYGIWGILQAKVNTTHKNMDSRRRTIQWEWNLLRKAKVWGTARSFRPLQEKIVIVMLAKSSKSKENFPV